MSIFRKSPSTSRRRTFRRSLGTSKRRFDVLRKLVLLLGENLVEHHHVGCVVTKNDVDAGTAQAIAAVSISWAKLVGRESCGLGDAGATEGVTDSEEGLHPRQLAQPREGRGAPDNREEPSHRPFTVCWND